MQSLSWNVYKWNLGKGKVCTPPATLEERGPRERERERERLRDGADRLETTSTEVAKQIAKAKWRPRTSLVVELKTLTMRICCRLLQKFKYTDRERESREGGLKKKKKEKKLCLHSALRCFEFYLSTTRERPQRDTDIQTI